MRDVLLKHIIPAKFIGVFQHIKFIRRSFANFYFNEWNILRLDKMLLLECEQRNNALIVLIIWLSLWDGVTIRLSLNSKKFKLDLSSITHDSRYHFKNSIFITITLTNPTQLCFSTNDSYALFSSQVKWFQCKCSYVEIINNNWCEWIHLCLNPYPRWIVDIFFSKFPLGYVNYWE